MNVGLLTEIQKDQLIGQKYSADSYFAPMQDCNDSWVITTQEIDNNINPEFDWVSTLTLINWCEPVGPPFPPTE